MGQRNNRRAAVTAGVMLTAFVGGCPFPLVSQQQRECEAAGGVWGHQGLFPGDPICNLRTTDFGDECTDSSQCRGACIADVELDECGTATSGQCSEFESIVGCHCFIGFDEEGVGSAICVD